MSYTFVLMLYNFSFFLYYQYDNFFGGMLGPPAGPGNFQVQLEGSWVRSMGRKVSDSIGPSNIKSLFRTHGSCTRLWAPRWSSEPNGPTSNPMVLRATSHHTRPQVKSQQTRGSKTTKPPPAIRAHQTSRGLKQLRPPGSHLPPTNFHARLVGASLSYR